MSSQEQDSMLMSFLKFIDIFSYIPVPQAYPVSTSKSRAGSIVILLLLIGYLSYDFYLFITNSVPTLNAYETSFVDKGPTILPKIAIGMKYADYSKNKSNIFVSSQYFLDYFIFELSGGLATSSNLNQIQNKTVIPLEACKNQSFTTDLTQYLLCPVFTSEVINKLNSQTLTVDSQGNIMVSITSSNNQKIKFMTLNLTVTIKYCLNEETNQNITCLQYYSEEDFLDYTQFMVISNQPPGFDYAKAQPVIIPQLDNNAYFISDLNQNKFLIVLYQTSTTGFTINPNYLTSFLTRQYNYTRILSGSQQLFNYNYDNILGIFTFRPKTLMNVVQVHYQTIIDRISAWSALVGFIVFVFAICFLGYNQRKFSKRNPDWERFDKVLHEKMIIQMQPTNKKNQDQNQNESQRYQKTTKNNQNQQSQNSEI